MRMVIKFSVICIFLLLSLLISPSNASVVDFVKEYTYQASEIDSKITCRALALEQVKRLLLEELGTYLESKTEVINFQLTKDRIITLTAGIVSAVVVSEKWDGERYYLKAKISADPKEVALSIDRLRNDTQKTKDMEESKKQTDRYLKEIKQLKKDLAASKVKNPNKMPSTSKIKDYNIATDGLIANDLFNKAVNLLFQSKYEEAIEILNRVLQKNPNYTAAYVNRGLAHAKMGDSQGAMEDYSSAIDIDANNSWAYSNRGFAYAKAGQKELALEDFNKAIELNPRNSDAYEGRGTAYLNVDDKRAIEDLSIAIKLQPNNPAAYNNRGNAYNSIGEYKKAIKDFKKVIQLNPKLNQSYSGLAYSYGKLGDDELAINNLKIAARLGNKTSQGSLTESGITW